MDRDSSVGIATLCGLDGPRIESLPIRVAERSRTRVWGRSLAGVTGSNPTGVKDICVVFDVQQGKRKRYDNGDTEEPIKYKKREKH